MTQFQLQRLRCARLAMHYLQWLKLCQPSKAGQDDIVSSSDYPKKPQAGLSRQRTRSRITVFAAKDEDGDVGVPIVRASSLSPQGTVHLQAGGIAGIGNMLGVLLKLWFVITLGWWIYNAIFVHRDKLSSFKDRDWRQAFDYGINNVFCEIRIFGNCRDISIPFFQRTHVNETFGLIVTFLGWPALFLVLCLALAWVLRRPARA